METLKRRLLLCVLAAVIAIAGPCIAAQNPTEDSVKAAYLYRFTQYIEWPTPLTSGEAFTIAVLNAPGVARELERLLPDHPIKNSAARVRVITRLQELGHVQMLYIGATASERLRGLISSIAFAPVLLVTDSEEGLEIGGVLNFVTENSRVRFEVSLPAADRLRLRISSELLAVAAHVRGASGQSVGAHRDSAMAIGE